MALWTWWTGDALPALAPIGGFGAGAARDVAELSTLTGLPAAEVAGRLEAGNRCYAARLGGVAVGYGWVADGSAAIGELDLAFRLEAGDRYLWDFATLPAWRGRGLYPRLLQAILRAEDRGRFWIINAPENLASARGIARAGFAEVGSLAFARGGRVGIAPTNADERAAAAAAVLGVPLVPTTEADPGVSPCWRCVMDALARGAREAACWPGAGLAAVACSCDTTPVVR
ncbi:MAG TPA: GNAT family N-acetyltransferase [Chloroflexota bacterium]|nr:GNAT family N-acetyltransferase [Chloroflexota bacterium]